MSTLTKEEVLHIARLAKITLTEEEVEKYTSQLGDTANYVENLKELNTEKVNPTNNASQTKNIFFEDGEKCTRQFTQKEALLNAKQKKDDKYFIVKRIM